MKIANRNGGFTLIEALTAIAILSFVASTGYSGLDALTATLKRAEEESSKWRDVAMFFDQVEINGSQNKYRSQYNGMKVEEICSRLGKKDQIT